MCTNIRNNESIVDFENLMMQIPTSASIMDHLRYYTSDTHLAGTQGDKLQAEWTRNRFLEYGISNTTIETYYPLLNYPLERRVAIVSGPVELQYEAKLVEEVVDEDESSKKGVSMPAFHGREGAESKLRCFDYHQRAKMNVCFSSFFVHPLSSLACACLLFLDRLLQEWNSFGTYHLRPLWSHQRFSISYRSGCTSEWNHCIDTVNDFPVSRTQYTLSGKIWMCWRAYIP